MKKNTSYKGVPLETSARECSVDLCLFLVTELKGVQPENISGSLNHV